MTEKITILHSTTNYLNIFQGVFFFLQDDIPFSKAKQTKIFAVLIVFKNRFTFIAWKNDKSMQYFLKN